MLHGFMVKYRDSEHTHPALSLFPLALPFFLSSILSLSAFLCSRLVCCLSLSLPLFPLLALYHSIPPSCIVQFISILLRCFPSSLPFCVWYRILLYSWTRIMSAWPLPLARPLRFPRVPSCDSPSRPPLPFLFRKANKARADGILCWLRS